MTEFNQPNSTPAMQTAEENSTDGGTFQGDEGSTIQHDQEAGEEQVDDGPTSSQPRVVQGNTNPRDFSVFDSRGNFVEKADR